MSFKLSVSGDFPATVAAEIPTGKGRAQKVSFDVRFKRLSMTEYQDMVQSLSDKDNEDRAFKNDQDVVDFVLVGFGDDVFDDNGNVLEFTPSNVAALCDVFPIRACVVKAFFDAYAQAKTKN